nr:site-specific integrase [Armatimonas rosea]
MLPEARKDITVEQLCAEYLAEKKAGWAPHTYQVAEMHIRLYITPHLGKVKLANLTIHAVSVWLRKLGQTRSAQVARGVLFRSCALAVRYDWLPRNPVELTTAPKVTPRKPKDLSRDDIRGILTAMQTPIPRGYAKGHTAKIDYYPIVAVLLGCGLRIGECLGLRWEDIDLAAGILHVRYSLGRAEGAAKGAAVLRKPKSKSSVRQCAMPRFLVAALEARRIEQEGHKGAAGEAWSNPFGLVFTTPTGAPLRYSSVAAATAHHLKVHGIEGITLHHLRHAYASLLLHEGVPVPVVSKSLGHANPGVTMRVYAHALQSSTDVVAVVMDELVDGKPEGS